MKNLRLFFLMGIAFCIGGQSLFAQSKREKQEQKEKEVKERIDSGRFTIEVNRALPTGGRSVNLTTLYSLEMRGDSVVSYLPYYGRAYSAPYGGGGGLIFTKPITGLESAYSKKGVAQLKFETRTDDDTYRFDIKIYPNGSASLHVIPTNKQGITYQGEMVAKQEK